MTDIRKVTVADQARIDKAIARAYWNRRAVALTSPGRAVRAFIKAVDADAEYLEGEPERADPVRAFTRWFLAQPPTQRAAFIRSVEPERAADPCTCSVAGRQVFVDPACPVHGYEP